MSKRKTKEPEVRSWIVRVECKVQKSVVCEGCTEKEAQSDPFKFSVDETEIGMTDWDVTDVEPNA